MCLRSYATHWLVLLQGEAGTGNVVEAVRHCRAVMGAVKALQAMDDDELYVFAKDIQAPIELVRQVSSSQSCSPASGSDTASPKSRWLVVGMLGCKAQDFLLKRQQGA